MIAAVRDSAERGRTMRAMASGLRGRRRRIVIVRGRRHAAVTFVAVLRVRRGGVVPMMRGVALVRGRRLTFVRGRGLIVHGRGVGSVAHSARRRGTRRRAGRNVGNGKQREDGAR